MLKNCYCTSSPCEGPRENEHKTYRGFFPTAQYRRFPRPVTDGFLPIHRSIFAPVSFPFTIKWIYRHGKLTLIFILGSVPDISFCRKEKKPFVAPSFPSAHSLSIYPSTPPIRLEKEREKDGRVFSIPRVRARERMSIKHIADFFLPLNIGDFPDPLLTDFYPYTGVFSHQSVFHLR